MIWWGVEREGFVRRVFGPDEAFRLERQFRDDGWPVVWACVSHDSGQSWLRVPQTSTVRPDPRPPVGPRKVVTRDRLGRGRVWWVRLLPRGWRRPEPFGRRRV